MAQRDASGRLIVTDQMAAQNYLRDNRDVLDAAIAAAKQAGIAPGQAFEEFTHNFARDHYQNFGQAEGRAMSTVGQAMRPVNTRSNTDMTALNPDLPTGAPVAPQPSSAVVGGMGAQPGSTPSYGGGKDGGGAGGSGVSPAPTPNTPPQPAMSGGGKDGGAGAMTPGKPQGGAGSLGAFGSGGMAGGSGMSGGNSTPMRFSDPMPGGGIAQIGSGVSPGMGTGNDDFRMVSPQMPGRPGPTPLTVREGSEFMQNYTNPFTDDVIGAYEKDWGRALQMAQNSNNALATSAGAFGGSGSGVGAALTNERALDQYGRDVLGARERNFNTAIGAGMQDAGSYNNMTQFGANLDYNRERDANMLNYQRERDANNLAFQYDTLGFQRDNALNNLDYNRERDANNLGFQYDRMYGDNAMTAANAIPGLLQTGMNMNQTDINNIFGIGSAQQGMGQRSLDLAYDDYLKQWQYPMDMLNWAAGLASGVPSGAETVGRVPADTGGKMGGAGSLLSGGAALLGAL